MDKDFKELAEETVMLSYVRRASSREIDLAQGVLDALARVGELEEDIEDGPGWKKRFQEVVNERQGLRDRISEIEYERHPRMMSTAPKAMHKNILLFDVTWTIGSWDELEQEWSDGHCLSIYPTAWLPLPDDEELEGGS